MFGNLKTGEVFKNRYRDCKTQVRDFHKSELLHLFYYPYKMVLPSYKM